MPRRLTAIFYADVEGYSRPTSADEEETHRRLGEHLDFIAATVREARGLVMHYAGDAVNCAIAMQDGLRQRNSQLRDHRKLQFRVGINIGDVIEDRSDVYGDGVNVAARLESVAPPGGICVSESVRAAMGSNPRVHLEDLGLGISRTSLDRSMPS